MDEQLYLIALVAGFAGAFGLWTYPKMKRNEPKNNE